ncbi:MAG: hypothetical protein AAGC68_02485 [Verrucomicrobiota bacterium]
MNPDWLNRMLIEAELNDDTATIVSWREFESNHTLHDSYWAGFASEIACGGEIVFCVDWDTHWQPKEIKDKFEEKRAYLFVKIPAPEKIEFSEFSRSAKSNSPIAGSVWRGGTLEIENIYGGKITMAEVDEIRLWLYDEYGEQHELKVEQVATRQCR